VKIKNITGFLLAVLLSALLTGIIGCTGDARNKLAGNWFAKENNISYRMILQKDGTGEMDIGGIYFILRYKADADTISFDVDPDILVSTYTISADRMALLINNLFGSGVDVHFTKMQ
jgi:hypothetical protein